MDPNAILQNLSRQEKDVALMVARQWVAQQYWRQVKKDEGYEQPMVPIDTVEREWPDDDKLQVKILSRGVHYARAKGWVLYDNGWKKKQFPEEAREYATW